MAQQPWPQQPQAQSGQPYMRAVPGGEGGMGSGGKGGGQQRPDLLGKENGQQNGFGGVMPPGVMPPGGEQMMHFAAGSLAQNVSGRFQSAAPIVGGYWNSLKYYFEVDNRFVLAKIKTVMLAAVLRGKKWKRDELENANPGSGDSYAKKFSPPSQDENAPDLYLPVMSFVTYVLVCSYVKGTNGKFTPEVLTEMMWSCVLFQLLEVAVVKGGLATLGVTYAPFLDMVANTGYKYVGLCVNMLLGLALGRRVYYGALVWTGSMASFFMLKTLANNYAKTTATGASPLRMPVLWGLAVLQFLSIWYLGYGGEFTEQAASAAAAEGASAAAKVAASVAVKVAEVVTDGST